MLAPAGSRRLRPLSVLKLEDLQVDTHVGGVEPQAAVQILYLKKAGPDAVDITYELLSGQVLKKTLFRSDEAKLSLASAGRVWAFDALPASFKLAAEATRIKLAHLFDPMMAIHTSDVEPLPHQISAVYEAMLPRQPLRFVLADDPGAGKTIMAGLLIRELMLRGDVERCLIIAPGSLVEQWQTELSEKFGLRFDILTTALVESTATGNAFVEHSRLIARLDQLARKEEWHDKLYAEGARWDLVIVDEAHKMSAHFKGNDPNPTTTQRYELGAMIGSPERTRNFLMMTATPHSGIEENFQAWLALVDPDRFYGKAKQKAEPGDIADVMRRMVKEDLLKFDGSKLFPERRAYTVKYRLSDPEKDLYNEVTDYVRNEMGRADQLEGKKKGMVGFALTILQRRVASSPYAIAQSLRRRRVKLDERLDRLKNPAGKKKPSAWEGYTADDIDEELTAEELEEIEDELVDEATAARTIPELMAEIAILKGLEQQAEAVLKSRADIKWDELSKILQSDAPEMHRTDGRRRKMIIFTEHKDTLDYLRKRIAEVLGPAAVIEIHGGTRREERLKAQEEFRQNAEVTILVATDAAGEGVNLQVANLMVNYDLPWNPNRIEQRFGRIHRIGQDEVCHMWNLVAVDTREGEVFERLFLKLDEERKALGGKVFDILGQTFDEEPLKDLLIQAVRYGDQPDVQAKLYEKVEGALDHKHIQDILDRNALTADVFSQERLYQVKEAMEKAEAKKLQPFYLRRFVTEGLLRYGGELRERETERYEIKHVPAAVRRRHSIQGGRKPVLERYERVTFDRHLMRVRTQAGGRPRPPGAPAHGRADRSRPRRRGGRAPHRHRARRPHRPRHPAPADVHDRPRHPRGHDDDPPGLAQDAVRRDRRQGAGPERRRRALPELRGPRCCGQGPRRSGAGRALAPARPLCHGPRLGERAPREGALRRDLPPALCRGEEDPGRRARAADAGDQPLVEAHQRAPRRGPGRQAAAGATRQRQEAGGGAEGAAGQSNEGAGGAAPALQQPADHRRLRAHPSPGPPLPGPGDGPLRRRRP